VEKTLVTDSCGGGGTQAAGASAPVDSPGGRCEQSSADTHSLQPRGGLAVSVVVPVYRGGNAFGACLESLKALDPAPEEIIVVSDGDTDGSADMAEKAGLTAVRLPRRGGPACARNVGVRHSRGDILFFIDADVTVPPNAIATVTSQFDQQREVAAIFGSYDDAPSETNFLSQYKNLFHHYVHQTSHEEASTFWCGCGAIRRGAFLAVAGFDETYPDASVEDIEFGYRVNAAGYRIRLVKSLQVKHLKRWTARSLLRADFLLRALPWTRLLLERKQLNNDLNLKLSSRASVSLVGILIATLFTAFWLPRLLWLSVAAAALLLVLNASLYRFFWHKRGLWFLVMVIPWHWCYYTYGGAAFAIGWIEYRLGRRSRGAPAVVVPASTNIAAD
jgi:GT2 family glycosyltransferase